MRWHSPSSTLAKKECKDRCYNPDAPVIEADELGNAPGNADDSGSDKSLEEESEEETVGAKQDEVALKAANTDDADLTDNNDTNHDGIDNNPQTPMAYKSSATDSQQTPAQSSVISQGETPGTSSSLKELSSSAASAMSHHNAPLTLGGAEIAAGSSSSATSHSLSSSATSNSSSLPASSSSAIFQDAISSSPAMSNGSSSAASSNKTSVILVAKLPPGSSKFKPAYEYLQRGKSNWGSDWSTCIESLLTLEHDHRFSSVSTTSFSSSQHPDVVF